MPTDALFVVDAAGRVQTVNRAACELSGFSDAELAGMLVTSLFPDLAGGEAAVGAEQEACLRARDGSELETAVAVSRHSPIGDEDALWLYSAKGIRVRKESERRLGKLSHDSRDANTRLSDEIQQRTWLQQRVLELTEEEHRQLAQELHDGLAQELTGIAFRCKALEGSLRERGHCEAHEAGELVRLINESIDGLRAIVRGLHPPSIGDLGLAAALARMCGDLEAAYHVSCHAVANEVPPLTVGVASHLFRIAQEAVGNAIRHGRPTQVTVVVGVRRSKLRMVIADDGTGFDLAATPRRGGLGLGGMRFRALAIGARIGVRSRSGHGCRVHVFLRLRAAAGPDFGLVSRRRSEPDG